MTVRDTLQTWRTLADANSKPSTREYHGELVQIFERQFPALDSAPAEVSTATAADFVQRIGHYSGSRFNALLHTLKSVCPHLPPMPTRRVTPKEVTLPSQAEFTALLAELDRSVHGCPGLVVRFLAFTGLRINEARQVRWMDVRADCIQAPASITKNGRPRRIPMVNGLAECVDQLKAVEPARDTVLPVASCRMALANACRRIGFPKLTHHDLRRLYATRCIESGVDLPTASRWLGHQDGGALLAKTYFHLADRHSLEMAKLVKIAA
mgnify:CR=1 FL=1